MYRRLILLRHGQTYYNATRRMQGQLDTQLDDVGREQAATAAERFADAGISRIIASVAAVYYNGRPLQNAKPFCGFFFLLLYRHGFLQLPACTPHQKCPCQKQAGQQHLCFTFPFPPEIFSPLSQPFFLQNLLCPFDSMTPFLHI